MDHSRPPPIFDAKRNEENMEKTRDEITVAPDANREQARREKAAEFLASHEDTSFTVEEERSVLRRIDSRVLPLLLGAYFFQQLDKSTLRCES